MALPSSCPLCFAPGGKQIIESRVVAGGSPGHGYYRCLECDVRFLWPRLDEEEEKRFYRDEFAGFMQSREGSGREPLAAEAHRERNEELRIERMQRLTPYLPEGGSVLEVGCASGFMLLPLRVSGYECMAIEPSGLFQTDLKACGIPTYSTLDEMLRGENLKFDFIMHFFVLEHVGNPIEFLKLQLGLLAAGGHLVFEIPCGNDALLDLYNLNSFRDFYFQIGHQWVFTPQSMEHVLRDLGYPYEIIPRQRYGLANHLTWLEHGRPGGNLGLQEALGPRVDSAYKSCLVERGSADTLMVVLSK